MKIHVFLLRITIGCAISLTGIAGFTVLHVSPNNAHAIISQLENQMNEVKTPEQRMEVILDQACEIFYEPSTDGNESFDADRLFNGNRRFVFKYYEAEFAELGPVDSIGTPTNLETVMNAECPSRVQIA